MHDAVLAQLPADAYVAAAAVADFTPRAVAAGKIKKRDGEDGLTLELVRTRDILAEVANHARRPRLVVGFAAETGDVEANARAKLAKKKLELRSEEHQSELQSLMRISYAVFCLNKKKKNNQ